MALLTPDDLSPFAEIPTARAVEMIADAEATASLAAPCITETLFLADTSRVAQARSVVRSAILRWHDAGSGAVTQQQVGPYGQSVDTRQARRGMFWPSEITQLREICSAFRADGPASAFAIDTALTPGSAHLPWCTLNFGGTYCSCGVDIAGEPIFEGA